MISTPRASSSKETIREKTNDKPRSHRFTYAHDRAEFARTSHEFNSALRALKYCMMTSRNAYTILCKRQAQTSENVLK